MNKPKCCICGNECENEWGNNPYPLVTDEDARCCDKCNDYVITFRICQSTTSAEEFEKMRQEFLSKYNIEVK